MKRCDIESIYKWDLSSIYKSDDEFYQELSEVTKELDKYNNLHDFATSSSKLLEFMKFDESISRRIEKLYTYAHSNNDTDMSDSKYQEMYGKAKDLYSKYGEVISFMNPTLLKYDYSVIEKYYDELPELKNYEKVFKEIFRYKKYTLSDREEKILSSLSNALSSSSENYSYLTDVDMKFGTIKDENGNDVTLTESNYGTYLSSKDRNVRENAFKRIFNTYGEYKNSIASMLSGEVEALTTLAKIRGYNSSMEASLFNEEIDPVVYNTLIDTVSKNLDVLFKYYAAKKDMLKLDELHYNYTLESVGG